MIGLNVALSVKYQPSKLFFGSDISVTAMPLTDNDPLASAQFFNMGLNVGYPLVSGRLGVAVVGGWFYRTTFVTESLFGFKNVTGIQLYPRLTYRLDSRQTVHFQISYSPIMDQLSLLGLAHRELAMSAGWSRAVTERNNLFVNLEYSSLSFTITEVDISSSSIGFFAGYTF